MVRTSGFHPDNSSSILLGDGGPCSLIARTFFLLKTFKTMEHKNITNYFTEDVVFSIQNAIKNAEENEVFFCGKINEDGVVVSVKDMAKGNAHSVPVHFDESKKCDVLIHNHPSGKLTPSDADIGVASVASENTQGFYIINNDCSDVYVVVKPVLNKKVLPLNLDEASLYISNGGSLSKLSDSFEERAVQVQLLKKICEAFNNNSIGVFEAGTGVGKSYAYLIPSILWSIKNNEKVVISTGTINLQQQLCEKDLPASQKIIGSKVKFVLMKGRQNFVCKRRFEEVINQRELFDEDTEILDKLSEWISLTKTGSKSELTFRPADSIWTKINSESDACMGLHCPYHSDCFVMKMRKEALGANIIVVNHHLLFADIESRMHGTGYDDTAVLPPFRRIIFDEAHGIEAAATSFFSESFYRFKLLKQINQLYRKRKNSESGYLCTLAILSSNEEKAILAYEKIEKIKTDILNMETAALDLLQDEYTLRLFKENSRLFDAFISLCSTLAKSIDDFTGLCREVMEGIADEDKGVAAYFETKVLLHRLEDSSVILRDFSSWEEKSDKVFWITKKVQNAVSSKDYFGKEESPFFVILNETPLDIAPMMNEGVFEPMETVICTSATLKTGRDYGYWLRRTGVSFVDKERLLFGDFPSPFPYEKNMLFAVPKDAPFPDEINFQAWIETAVSRLINVADGRTLVLFTSYESLKSCYNAAVRGLKGFDGTLYKQGDDDNARLLENFKKNIKSVLFATDSFWQGVDVPGESLSQVIIVKLPFTVPSDPVFKARAEAVQNRGGNSFMELSVPEAVIKFRQGVGRLMRRSSDKGVVTVLDRRVFEKRYGSIFLASLPQCKRLYENFEVLCDKITSFIFN